MPKSRPKIRIQKFIAASGYTSRRKAELLLLEGRVKVNGQQILELGSKVCEKNDVVEVDGNILNIEKENKHYFVFNKPRSVISSVSDPEGRKTVRDYFPFIKERLYPVGRLDYLSEGLIILTNDGDFTHEILHPSKNIEKVYEVKVFGHVDGSLLSKVRKGIVVEGKLLRPTSVRILKYLHKKTWIEFRLTEGINREIRKICEFYGLTIDKLRRVAIGGLSIQGLQPEEFKFYSKKEILKAIKNTSNNKFLSNKRSVKNFRTKNFVDATNDGFKAYRKNNYYNLIQLQKEKIAEAEADAALVPND